MSAPTLALQNTSATSAKLELKRYSLLNKILNACTDETLYESADEQKPSTAAIVLAADVLGCLESHDIESVEIEPYFGELSLIWRQGRNKRVKAMFGQEPESYSIYYEQMQNGRVVDHHLLPNAERAHLQERLAWLHQ